MKKFLIVFILIFGAQNCYALDIVYPKKQSVTVNAPSSFLIGSARTDIPVKVNGQTIAVHPSGGFAYVVNLSEGKNTFIIEEGNKKLTYEIIRPKSKGRQVYAPPKFVGYSSRKNYFISTSNAPLRQTPVNAGINRLSHLQENIPVVVDGENSSFYRVVLDDKTKAWIAKTNVKAFSGYLNTPAEVLGKKYIDDNEFYRFIFELDKMTPFVITEGDPFILKFYNVKNNPDGTYTFTFPLNQKLIGYSGYYLGNRFILKVRKYPCLDDKKPLKDIRIAVDAGHGGSEAGAVGCLGNKEKDINLSIAKYLETELKSRGAKVIMTRTEDINVDLRERVDMANQDNAMILLSIHGNALPDGADPNKRGGTSVFYYYTQAKPLAESILEEMTKQLKTQNDKVRQGSLALVRNTDAVSVLIEVAYLINPDDNAKLIDKKFQKQCAKAIADGIEKYLQK